MSRKGLGMTTVVDSDGKLLGLFTDGDLRRLLDHGEVAIKQLSVEEVMLSHFTTIEAGRLAAEALRVMDEKRINALPVVDADGNLIGAINMHDLLRAGVV
jgi:arabinose-5-phosphate isomerase